MFTDPLLAYATKTAHVDLELARISQLDKMQCDDASANRFYELFRQAAESGSAYAMCMCSRFCIMGWGTIQSNDKAFWWAEKAAATGFAPGHFEVGTCFEQGVGVSINFDQAIRHYELAIEGGFGFAAFHLARTYSEGKSCARHMIKAVEYAKRAYLLNEPMASSLLASWYELGDGVVRDTKEAVLWYERSAAIGDSLACHRLSMAYATGELGLTKNGELAQKYAAMFESLLSTAEIKLGIQT